MRTTIAGALGLAALAACPTSAPAYESASTLAGITQRAVLASRLHRRLIDQMGRSLGVFDPVRLHLDTLPPPAARSLRTRLFALDPTEGYVPEELADEGRRGEILTRPLRQTALGWLSAGTAIEGVPSWRIRSHFLDPRTGQGLTRQEGVGQAGAAARGLRYGLQTFRQLLTGTGFDGNGPSALAWMASPDNEQGLPAFERALAAAVSGATPRERDTALAQALLAAGGILALLSQMGDPAYVRNDLGQVLGTGQGPAGSTYERWVAVRYGRAGVPAPLREVPDEAPITRLADLFVDPAGRGSGLAERTARRFLSAGTLPGSGMQAPLPAGLDGLLPLSAATAGRAIPRGEALTQVPRGWPAGASGYVRGPHVRRLAFWQRVQIAGAPALRFGLDERCYAEYAAALLPEIGRYAQRALDFLFRGDLRLSQEGEEARVAGLDLPPGAGQLTIYGEGADGLRRALQTIEVIVPERNDQAGAEGVIELARVKLPAGLSRVAALYRGKDGAGQAVIVPGWMSMTAPSAP
jgi:hypothetical protein